MDIKEKVLTVKLPGESHRRLKVLASSEGLSIKRFLMNIVNDIYNNKFEGALIIEPITEEDLPIIERGRQEYARGEYQDFDEMVEEIENESNSNELS